MNEFTPLRMKALDKRNKAIEQAKREYEQTLVRIAELEQDLFGTQPVKNKTISECVTAVIPQERPFTTNDIMASLLALDNSKNWRKRSVDWTISRLREKGILKRVKRARNHNPAVYAFHDLEVESEPFQGLEFADVIEAILRDAGKELNPTEIVVAMMDGGYETAQTPNGLRNRVGQELQKHPMRFKKFGYKWKATANH